MEKKQELFPSIDWQGDPVAILENITDQYQLAYRVAVWILLGLAILGGIGDVVSTAVLLDHPQLVESVAFTRWVINEIGMWALWPKKLLILGGALTVSRRLVPRPLDLIPIGSVAAGQIWLTVGNLQTGFAVGAL
jgi:hypothetical protein